MSGNECQRVEKKSGLLLSMSRRDCCRSSCGGPRIVKHRIGRNGEWRRRTKRKDLELTYSVWRRVGESKYSLSRTMFHGPTSGRLKCPRCLW